MNPLVVAALVSGGAQVLGNIFSARSANRFSERMSSTAHQREVADLQAAGLNPMLSARGSGASSPQGQSPEVGEAIGRGVSTALAVRQAKASIELLEAQGESVRQDANLKRFQSADLQMQWNAGKFEIMQQQVESGRLSNDQMRQMMPHLLARAREEVQLTASSARAAKARARLDELASKGALNEAELQELLRQGGPWMKLLGRAILLMRR